MNASELGAWWPEVARRIEAGLASRGVPRREFADIVQETAARALVAQPDVADADELTRWAITVARRIAIDRHRRSTRAELVPLEAVEPSATAPEPSRVVEGRLQWQKTMRAMSMLSSLDREALEHTLAAEPTAAETRREAVRDAVRLHRARTRLNAAVAKLGVVIPVGPVWRFLRKSTKFAPGAAAVGMAAFMFFSLNVQPPDMPEPDVEIIDPVPDRMLPRPVVVTPATEADPDSDSDSEAVVAIVGGEAVAPVAAPAAAPAPSPVRTRTARTMPGQQQPLAPIEDEVPDPPDDGGESLVPIPLPDDEPQVQGSGKEVAGTKVPGGVEVPDVIRQCGRMASIRATDPPCI